MDIKFYSYFNSQKNLVNNPKVFSAINNQKQKVFTTNENSSIFIYFLTIEHLMIKSQIEKYKKADISIYFQKNSVYSLFFQKNVSNVIKQINTRKSTIKNIDNFVSYFSSFLVFSSHINFTNKLSPVVNYFDNYTHFYITNSLYSNINTVTVTKNERFQYQIFLDNFVQNESFSNFNSGSVVLFNKIFFDNKSIKLEQNKTTKRLYSKQFTNLLINRNSINKSNKALSLFKYNNFRFKSVVSKNKFRIPFNVLYWNNPKRVKKSKVNKKPMLENVAGANFYAKTYAKTTLPHSFSFQRYPTDFKETIVNVSQFSQIKNVLSLITNSRFSFYQINALSLARYAFDEETKNKNIEVDQPDKQAPTLLFKSKKSYFFLSQLEQKLESRYRYVAVHIKDRVRVSFFAIYLKKANFLATFYAFVLSKLPRKRKETKLISFMITLLKIFSAERKEIIGVRIRFQGRLNRWRRTKHIVGKKGRLYDYSHNNYMDFGIGQAITRKGTQGIRIWLAYKPEFAMQRQKAIVNYIALPRPIKAVSIKS